MKLIIGLGNPGPKYETSRHNAGFLAIDRLVERFKAGTPVAKQQGEVYSAILGKEKILLIKPQTFMNLSGRCIGPLFNFYHCEPKDMIVIHDDLALEPLMMRIKEGGGTGGHNGLKSVDDSIGADKTGYYRIRLGIGHPTTRGLRISPVDYVLEQFSDDELEQLDRLLDKVGDAVSMILAGDISKAMTEFNRR